MGLIPLNDGTLPVCNGKRFNLWPGQEEIEQTLVLFPPCYVFCKLKYAEIATIAMLISEHPHLQWANVTYRTLYRNYLAFDDFKNYIL